jgi:hypothetical protein
MTMRYRLATLLAVVSAAAAFCAAVRWTWIEPTLRRERAIAAIERLGGQVGYASPAMTRMPASGMYKREYREGPPVVGPAWAITCFGERYFVGPVTSVNYVHATRPVVDGDLRILNELQGIELLDMTHHAVIQTSHGVEGTNSGCPQITDAAVEHIVKLKDLQYLVASNSKISDEGAITLSRRLPKLKVIGLDETQITDASLEALAELNQLRFVCVRSTKITAAGVSRFRNRRPDVFIVY